MSKREQRRAQVLTRVLDGSITLQEAAIVMRLSLRQARRLKSELRQAGPEGLVHGNRGRTSKRRTASTTTDAVVAHYRGKYVGSNVQHFTELLAEREGITLSVATVRRILHAAGVATPKTRPVPKHRSRRERMAAEGMLLQIDASPFRWLGKDGPKWSLVGAIDDATGDPVAAVFREQEDAAGYMELLRQVVERRGIPAAVYRDRHMIFEVSKRVRTTIEEDFAGTVFPTQVGRLLAELGVESIAAYSPQAKGRVERSWRTQQDRLVTELRLAGVQTLAEANAFLPGYLERYRARFAVPPRSPDAVYVPVADRTELDRLFCFKYHRVVGNDNTVHFAGRLLQIPRSPEHVSYARTRVEVHERLDGSLAVWHAGRALVVVPGPTEAPTIRSRESFANPASGRASQADEPKPMSWEEVRHRARAASPGPAAVAQGKPTADHPYKRQAAEAAELRRQRQAAKTQE